MNVFVARDGKEIGEFPPDKLQALARTGVVQPTDYYWGEGMSEWRVLTDLVDAKVWPSKKPGATITAAPAPPTTILVQPGVEISESAAPEVAGKPRLLPVVAVCLLLGAIAAGWIYFVRSDNSSSSAALFSGPTITGTNARADDSTEKAAADLKQRIDRLPASPAPPLNTFYYGVKVDLEKMTSSRASFRAVIWGSENVVDPGNSQTVIHTDFTLEAEYINQEWVFRRYAASVSDLVTLVTTQIESDEKTNTLPSIASMLRIKI